MRVRAGVLALALVALAAGCDKHEFEPPSRAAQVAQADSLYTTVLFDSIRWPSDSARAFEGNNVFATHCRKCHGQMGEGGTTPYGEQRGLNVPSLLRPDWPVGDDLDSLRYRIFIGHPDGMPTWGVAGITPREIDAAAHYIVRDLRPEVLGNTR